MNKKNIDNCIQEHLAKKKRPEMITQAITALADDSLESSKVIYDPITAKLVAAILIISKDKFNWLHETHL